MGEKLDILMLEDVASDAELVQYELRKAPLDFTIRRVDTREDFLQELERRTPDLILADYNLPSFDGLSALGLAQGMRPEVPFIFVSGAMGEEVAIDSLKQGATDYVLKQRLGRLGAAVQRALREARERRQRHQAEEMLRESEERFRTLFQTAGSVIAVVTPTGRILEFNPEAERATGWRRHEVLGRNFLKLFVPSAYEEAVKSDFQKVLAGQETRGFETPLKLRGGGECPFLWNVNRLLGKDGQILGVMAVGQDITERKRAEEDLRESEQKMRILTSQILTAQEDERKRISRELHDELGQSLTVLKLNLRAAGRHVLEPPGVKEELGQMALYLDEVIDKVRRLSRALSPAILEDLGLPPALNYLVNEFSRYYEIDHDFDLDDLDRLFPKEAQIIIFRIFQESLTNIARHAQAKKVRLAIQQSDEAVLFEVEDDGQGFEVSQVLSRPSMEKGLGLAALSERAKMLGGTLQINSQKGRGTRVTCAIPVRREEN
ncbi:MAG: PAS domain S-box protein [Deltaproteobacteria bacterium]|nr:PAS domain S-box protein [Deltaproteobacteria bacterium]